MNSQNPRDFNHFKVHLLSKDNNKETRRFFIEKNCSSLSHITGKLLTLFPVLQDKNFTVYWKDEDNDDIAIKSEEEWNIFLACTKRSNGYPDTRNIYVTYENTKSKCHDKDMHIYMTLPDFSATAPASCSKSESEPIHPGVVCDSCESSIVGTRYKCLVCDDFDLCPNCEKLGLHSQHFMVRIARPELWNRHWGSRFSKDLFRQIKKTTKLESHRRHRMHDHHEKKSSCPAKEEGVSWIDLFAQVMNNWGKVINDDSEEDAAQTQTRNQQPENKPEEKKMPETVNEKSKEENVEKARADKRDEKMETGEAQSEGKQSEQSKLYPKLPEKPVEVDDEDWAMVNDDASNSQTRPVSPRGSVTSSASGGAESSRIPQLQQALQRMRETGFDNQLMAEIMELWLQKESK